MGGLQHAEAGESRAMSSHPTLSAPWWSRLTFHWANPLMADGFRKHRAAEKAAKGGEAGQVDTLSPEDIWPLPPDQQARSVASRFIKEWEKELAETGGIDGGNGQVGAALGALAGLEMELDSTIVGITKSNLPGADVDGNGKNAAGEKDGIKVEDSGSGTGSQAKKSPSLFRAVWRTYRKQFYVAALLRILADGCAIGTPLVLRQFVIFLSNSASSFAAGQPLPEAWRGYLMAFGLGAMLLIQTFAMALTWMLSQKIGFEIKTALMSYTYQKLLRLSAGARLTFTGGNIINLVSTDATRIDRALPEMHTLYSAPITIIIGLALLITNLGWPALVGGAVLVFVMIPFTGKIMSVAAKLREKGTKWTDLRVKVTNEAVSGIRVVKFLGWTKPIVSNIADNIRATEMKYVRGILFYRVFVGLISMSGPILASIAMFLSFSAAGGTLTPAVVLSSIALLELIRWPLLLLPMSLSWTVDAWVSLGRFSALFLAPEVDASESRGSENGVDGVVVEEGTVLEWDAVPSVESEEDLRKQKEAARKGFVWRTLGRTKKGKSKETEMAMEEAVKTVPEDKEGESPVAAGESFGASGGTFSVVLKQLQMKPGTLTTVVGPVGSGKSTLLAGLIGDVKVVRGGVKASGTVAYCAQTPWIQSASIRDNILFGLPYDEKRFVEVIRVCGLERDLSIFTDGDFTAVGEKGLSLSGGQKARLALARAIYQDAAIYILDDILSALDSHTGAFVYENCIRGFLRPKTVVLATHALHVLSSSDQIICLRKGKIVEMGTYKDLVGAEESEVEGAGYLARMVKEYGMAKESEEEEEEQVGSEASGSTAEVEVEVEGAVVVGNLQGIKDNKQAVGITTKDAARKQFQDEEKFQGAVTFAVWRK